jgi:hypothetical protein
MDSPPRAGQQERELTKKERKKRKRRDKRNERRKEDDEVRGKEVVFIWLVNEGQKGKGKKKKKKNPQTNAMSTNRLRGQSYSPLLFSLNALVRKDE